MNNHFRPLLTLALALLILASFRPVLTPVFSLQPIALLPYKDPHLPVDRRVEDLLSRMTAEEKIRQLDMYWGKEVADMDGPKTDGHEAAAWSESKTSASLGSIGAGSVHDLYPLTADITNSIQRYAIEKTRLGIPVLFIEEGLHGYSGLGSTSFPIPLQLSGAWDTTLLYDVGRAIATETRAHGVDMLLAPVLCLPRDPRWGRVEETYGEDTYLDARNGVAMVKGLQGKGVGQPDAVIAEPKHFAVHGIPEAGSNTAPVNIGEREARGSFLYVFEKAVREGGALSMMAAYSELDGIPCVDNKWLLTDVLRKEWGFKGFVLSDLGAIRMSFENHRTAASIPDVLLGHTNPSGKLPMTFPRSEGQIPFYYNHKPTSGHRYVDEKDTPLFPFGHGLSYTHFGYTDLKAEPATIPVGASADIRVTVTNTGSVAGSEVAQLYVREVVSSVTTPQMALKGFARVALGPGESRTIHFRLGPDELALWNREMKRVVEPGEFKLMVGSSSADIRLTDSLWVSSPRTEKIAAHGN